MNWYKKAKQFGSYWEIGHIPDQETYLWTYIDNKIKTVPLSHFCDTHLDVWPNITDNTYRGRFEKETKFLSIINPFKNRPIPNVVLSQLYDTFGNDIKIMEFN